MFDNREGRADDEEVYYYIDERLKLEGETENMGICTKERKGITAEVLVDHSWPLPCRERRWFVLKRPRCDINGGSETEVTVTSKRHAQAERAKRQKREEKAPSVGGAARDPGPEDVLRYGGALPREAQSEGGRRPECRG